jgi:hypothetical protein
LRFRQLSAPPFRRIFHILAGLLDILPNTGNGIAAGEQQA